MYVCCVHTLLNVISKKVCLHAAVCYVILVYVFFASLEMEKIVVKLLYCAAQPINWKNKSEKRFDLYATHTVWIVFSQ